MDGWIKLHRKMLDNPVVCKDADYVAIWVHILLSATHEDYETWFNGKTVTLHAGQVVLGRQVLSQKYRVSESKVQRILSCLESEQLIEQQTTRHGRLISVVKWERYQKTEQQNEQQLNNKRTTTEQQLNTKQEQKNKRTKEKDIYIHHHGEFGNVKLTDEELEKLRRHYGETKTDAAIKFLDEYIADKGYKTKSKTHYLAMRRWVFDAVEKRGVPADNVSDEWERAHRPMTEEERRIYAKLI